MTSMIEVVSLRQTVPSIMVYHIIVANRSEYHWCITLLWQIVPSIIGVSHIKIEKRTFLAREANISVSVMVRRTLRTEAPGVAAAMIQDFRVLLITKALHV